MSKIFASRIRIVYVGYVMKNGYILLSIISERCNYKDYRCV